MAFGKKQMLAAFLEKDNVKLLAFEVAGKSVTRIFGGQVSFGEDALRDAFIADPVKFSSQVKAVLAQKPPLTEITEGILFVHSDKTFIKALPPSESLDAFVRSLPFFKEELVIQEPNSTSAKAPADKQVNYVAFEKKLVEDFERPFLESNKKIISVNSAAALLAKKYAQTGRYLLILPFEKDVTVLACQDGVILDVGTFPKDVWVSRANEFRMGKGFSDMTNVFVVSNLEPGVSEKMKTEQQLNVTELGGGDIYDLVVGAALGTSDNQSGGGLAMPKLAMPQIPGQKYVFLVLAAIVGFVLVFLVLKSMNGLKLPGQGQAVKMAPKPTNVEKKTPAPTPEAKPSDFKVNVYNGSGVTGEASALSETLSGMGFDVADTANATSSGFAATRLRSVSGVPASIVSQLKAKLLETYASVVEEGMASSSAQIEIIIGEKKE